MSESEQNKIKNNLANHLKKYIEAIIEKYGKYIAPEKQESLKNIRDFESIIKIANFFQHLFIVSNAIYKKI